jgi:hypothetical protein
MERRASPGILRTVASASLWDHWSGSQYGAGKQDSIGRDTKFREIIAGIVELFRIEDTTACLSTDENNPGK